MMIHPLRFLFFVLVVRPIVLIVLGLNIRRRELLPTQGHGVGPWLVPIMKRPHAVALGLIIALGGFVGDLTLSAVKRDLGVKDCGSMLPGHGGILDRVDSLTYTAPLFFHFVNYCYG